MADPQSILALLQLGADQAGRWGEHAPQTAKYLRSGQYGEAGKSFMRGYLPLGIGESIFPQESPAEKYARMMLAQRQQLINQLQPQAAGQPSAASRGVEAALKQATNRYMQAYGASAQQQGIAGTTVAKAQQGRMAAGVQQAMAQARGQLATSAQQQIGALTQGAMQTQLSLEMQEQQAKSTFFNSLGELFGMKQGGKLDPETQKRYDELTDIMRALVYNTQSGSGQGTYASQIKNPLGTVSAL